jgi:hypothetical protein
VQYIDLTSTFEGKDAPNTHEVADAIVRLVGQSKGSRAPRTVVGASFGSYKANEGVAPAQAKVVEAPRPQPSRKGRLMNRSSSTGAPKASQSPATASSSTPCSKSFRSRPRAAAEWATGSGR